MNTGTFNLPIRHVRNSFKLAKAEMAATSIGKNGATSGIKRGLQDFIATVSEAMYDPKKAKQFNHILCDEMPNMVIQPDQDKFEIICKAAKCPFTNPESRSYFEEIKKFWENSGVFKTFRSILPEKEFRKKVEIAESDPFKAYQLYQSIKSESERSIIPLRENLNIIKETLEGWILYPKSKEYLEKIKSLMEKNLAQNL